MKRIQKNRISHVIAKALVCSAVIALMISGITFLSIASVLIWFYGEDLLSDQISGHFELVEKFLPALCIRIN